MDGLTTRLLSWARGKKAPPHKVLIYPTSRCNLLCPFCFQRKNPYDHSKDLPHERWLQLTEELCRMGVDVLQISGGGEPMTVGNTVIGMMKIIKSNGATGRLVNNGTRWENRHIRSVVELGWDNVIFSVDGSTPEINDASRGVKGTLERTVAAIKTFNSYKQELGKDKPILEFSTVVTKLNYSDLGEIIRLAGSLGVSNVTFEPVFVSNSDVAKLKVTEEQRNHIMGMVETWKKLAESCGVSTNLDDVFNVKEIESTGELTERIYDISKSDGSIPFLKIPCFEPWIWPKIEADGTVGPCSTIFLSDFSKKNVSVRDRSFEDVWYGEEFSAFRKSLIACKLFEGCANCVSTHIPLNKRMRDDLRKEMA
jgi:MoaA/NifB/PqqE/SkfB family radical SAM enzyme